MKVAYFLRRMTAPWVEHVVACYVTGLRDTSVVMLRWVCFTKKDQNSEYEFHRCLLDTGTAGRSGGNGTDAQHGEK